MKDNSMEIKIAIYIGVCIYNRLRKSIVEINDKFVSLDDKIDLSLYLGILHSQNSISNLLSETQLLKGTKIEYTKLEMNKFITLYNRYFKNVINQTNLETLKDYFNELLSKKIIIELNNEYNFIPQDFINISNKNLVKK